MLLPAAWRRARAAAIRGREFYGGAASWTAALTSPTRTRLGTATVASWLAFVRRGLGFTDAARRRLRRDERAEERAASCRRTRAASCRAATPKKRRIARNPVLGGLIELLDREVFARHPAGARIMRSAVADGLALPPPIFQTTPPSRRALRRHARRWRTCFLNSPSPTRSAPRAASVDDIFSPRPRPGSQSRRARRASSRRPGWLRRPRCGRVGVANHNTAREEGPRAPLRREIGSGRSGAMFFGETATPGVRVAASSTTLSRSRRCRGSRLGRSAPSFMPYPNAIRAVRARRRSNSVARLFAASRAVPSHPLAPCPTPAGSARGRAERGARPRRGGARGAPRRSLRSASAAATAGGAHPRSRCRRALRGAASGADGARPPWATSGTRAAPASHARRSEKRAG